MPNYIKNRIELIGSDKDVKDLLSEFSTHIESKQRTSYDGDLTFTNGPNFGWFNVETGMFKRGDMVDTIGVPEGWTPSMDKEWTRFPDFNKIVPMPESLDLQIHSGIETAVKNALKLPLHKNEIIGAIQARNREDAESPLTLSDSDFELYLKALSNVKKHGFMYWYDWRVEKWGTKWNSSECEKEGDSFFFQTAWAGVPNLIEKIHQALPSVEIIYEYADENTGSNCASFLFKSGSLLSFVEPENQSVEAFELSFKLWPEDKEYYELIDGKYKFKEEE